ncbi:MAG: methyltransferase family protein [Acidobacteriaceae bacterium]
MISFIEHWIGYLWLAFIVIWWSAAFASKRSVQRQGGGSRLLQSVIVLIGLVFLFSLDHAFTGGWPIRNVVPRTTDWMLAGAALTVAGMLFAVWARVVLGSNWSGWGTIKQDHELILRGPYAFVRHPIYTGGLAALLGTAVVYGAARCFVGLLICAFGFWLKSQTEEQFMIQQFGEQYVRYRKRVRALVPFVL